MPITLHIPHRLQTVTNKKSQIRVTSAVTLLDALLQLAGQCPDIRSSLFNTNNTLNPYLRLSINDQIVSDLSTPLNSECDIVIFMAIAGG